MHRALMIVRVISASSITLMLAAFAVCFVLSSDAMAKSSKVTRSFDSAVTCTSTGQNCSPPQYVDLFIDSSRKRVDVKFKVGALACSSLKVSVAVDNHKAGSSSFLGYTGVKTPKSTQAINLGVLAPGHHLVAVSARGKTGGCNIGLLGSWGGTFKFIGTSTPATATRRAFTGTIPAQAQAVTL